MAASSPTRADGSAATAAVAIGQPEPILDAIHQSLEQRIAIAFPQHIPVAHSVIIAASNGHSVQYAEPFALSIQLALFVGKFYALQLDQLYAVDVEQRVFLAVQVGLDFALPHSIALRHAK